MERYYNYSDINLVPKHSIVESRSICDTRIEFAGRRWNLPIIPANMSSVISMEKALELEAASYFYILHRFYEYTEILDFVSVNQNRFLSISVGIKPADEGLIKTIADRGLQVNCVTIDVAHADSDAVGKMAAFIKQYLPSAYLIIGNVGTVAGVQYLHQIGADAVKIGIGSSSVCTTYNQTGFATIGMFTTIQRCAEEANRLGMAVIADGGIRSMGDVTKAIVAGADMVMVGGLFASLSDSPAEFDYANYGFHEDWNIPDDVLPIGKFYYGSASAYQKGDNNHVEGIKISIPYDSRTYFEFLTELTQALRSSISYAGGKDLSALQGTSYVYIS